MNWELYVSGTRIYPCRCNVQKSLVPTNVDSLTFEIPEEEPVPLTCGAPVEFKLGGQTKLTGHLIRKGSALGSDGPLITAECASKFQLLLDRQIRRNLNTVQDPANLVKALNQPAEPIQFNNKVQIVNLTADTYVSSGAPDENYGDLQHVYARMLANETDTDIIFQLCDIAPWMDIGLNWAYLYMWVFSRTGTGPPNLVNVSVGRVLGPWTEMGLTWNNKPTIATGWQDTPWDGSYPFWLGLDIKSLINLYAMHQTPDPWCGWNVQINKHPNDPAVERGFFAYSREEPVENLRPYIKASVAYTGLGYLTATAQYAPTEAYLGVDGIMESHYGSGEFLSVEQWYKVDLSETKTICEAIFYCRDGNYPYKFKVEVSTDDEGWTEVYRDENNANPTLRAVFPATNARYVKVTALANPGDNRFGWHIFECDFYKPAAQILPEGTIINVGKAYTVRTDYELVGEAMWSKCAVPVGFDLWVGVDGKLYFMAERGTDRTLTAIFKKGENCAVARKEYGLPEATVITVLGHGEGREQLQVTVRNQSAIDSLKAAGYGEGIREKVFVEKDMIDNNLTKLYAETLLEELSQPYELLEVNVPTIPAELDVGDWVTVQHPDLGIDGKYRVQTLDIWLPDHAFVMQVASRKIHRTDLSTDLLWALMSDNRTLANVLQSTKARTET